MIYNYDFLDIITLICYNNIKKHKANCTSDLLYINIYKNF